MMIPIRDTKISQFTTRSLRTPIHFLSSVRGPIDTINNNITTKKILLSTCVDKDYFIAFSDYDTILQYKQKAKHPYFVNTAAISDVLDCGKRTHTSLLIKHGNIWYKLDPYSHQVSIHTIHF